MSGALLFRSDVEASMLSSSDSERARCRGDLERSDQFSGVSESELVSVVDLGPCLDSVRSGAGTPFFLLEV